MEIKERLTANSPPWLLNSYLRLKRRLRGDPYKGIEIVREAGVQNIYHCCVIKTGSQWLKQLFSDPVVYKYSGLRPLEPEPKVQNQLRNIIGKGVGEPIAGSVKLTENRILTPLYLHYEGFKAIKKPEHYKAFFVMRDPRDLLISGYFSLKKIHRRSRNIDPVRKKLKELSLEEGLIYTINFFEEKKYWNQLRSWINMDDDNVLLTKFEELTADDNVDAFKKLFDHLELPIPEVEIVRLTNRYSFSNLTKGRVQGQESEFSHFRKGVSGDWRNYFTNKIEDEFYNVTKDLVDKLGYSSY